jgi:hypothetical protein
MSLPAWVNECGLHGMTEYHARVVKAFSIAWDALEKNVELNMRDALGPELRSQNEGNYRRSKEAMRRIEEVGE